MKKLLSFFLSLVMLLGLALPASAATAKAVTMRVQLVEGSVTIKDASGISLSFFEDMQIYSGYSVVTGDNSFAYISLDDSKAIKLDMNTSVTIKKSGRKLQVKLIAGQIIFNVTEPLAGNEDLEIRTSTMVTGIRGSSGVMSKDYLMYATGSGIGYVKEGSQINSFHIKGGQRLDIALANTSALLSDALISGFPSLYLNEVAENTQLQHSIDKGGVYSSADMIAMAPIAEAKEQQEREVKVSGLPPLPSHAANSDEGVDPAFVTGSGDGNPVIPELPENYPKPVESTFTITWIDGSGTNKFSTVTAGEVPVYPGGADPVKPAD